LAAAIGTCPPAGGFLIWEEQRLAEKHRELEALRADAYVVAKATTHKDATLYLPRRLVNALTGNSSSPPGDSDR
jgi:hypothetical protein